MHGNTVLNAETKTSRRRSLEVIQDLCEYFMPALLKTLLIYNQLSSEEPEERVRAFDAYLEVKPRERVAPHGGQVSYLLKNSSAKSYMGS